jgi:hypothetical protein
MFLHDNLGISMEQPTPKSATHLLSKGHAGRAMARLRIKQAPLPIGLVMLGLASVMGLQRFKEDLQGWGFAIAALVFAALFLGALELARRQQHALIANLAGMLGVLLLSALFWSLDQQLRTVVQLSPPPMLAEGLSVAACIALFWFYRLPALAGLLSVGTYMMTSGLLAHLNQQGGEPWNSLQMWLPVVMGVGNVAVAACMDRSKPQYKSHATALYLLGLLLIQVGVLMAVQRQSLPLWGLSAIQMALLAGMFWLHRPGLVALMLVVTSLQVFLVLGPMSLGVPIGWDLILAALGSSLLLWYALWYLLRRRALQAQAMGQTPKEPEAPTDPVRSGDH